MRSEIKQSIDMDVTKEYERLGILLPESLKSNLQKLKIDRDDEKVSVQEWNDYADLMMVRGKQLAKPQKTALSRCIKLLAREERVGAREEKRIARKEKLNAK